MVGPPINAVKGAVATRPDVWILHLEHYCLIGAILERPGSKQQTFFGDAANVERGDEDQFPFVAVDPFGRAGDGFLQRMDVCKAA
jgi:hypothetical protein